MVVTWCIVAFLRCEISSFIYPGDNSIYQHVHFVHGYYQYCYFCQFYMNLADLYILQIVRLYVAVY